MKFSVRVNTIIMTDFVRDLFKIFCICFGTQVQLIDNIFSGRLLLEGGELKIYRWLSERVVLLIVARRMKSYCLNSGVECPILASSV